MDIGVLTAFLGGVLALLSPCSALIVPAFLASTAGAGGTAASRTGDGRPGSTARWSALWQHGAFFYGGLLLILVPLGAGAGAFGAVLAGHRGMVVVAAALLMIGLGAVQLLGAGFDVARLLPGLRILQGRLGALAGRTRTVALGMVSGVAGFCVGPVLGAVLTLAAAQGSTAVGSVLLAVYAAGMALPLLLIAALAMRAGALAPRPLRGRTVTAFGRELHLTAVLSGAILIAAGILFWASNGLVGVPEVVPARVHLWLQGNAGLLAHPVVDVLAVLLAAGLVLALWRRARRRSLQDG